MGGGVPSSQVRTGGYPILGQDGGTPSQVRTGGGIPHPRSGWGVPPPPPPSAGWGTPRSMSQVRIRGYPNWNSMACTCYAAVGMPLAFTQKDFLFFRMTSSFSSINFNNGKNASAVEAFEQ